MNGKRFGLYRTALFLMIACVFFLRTTSFATAAEGAPEKTLRFVTVFPANTTDPHRCHTAFILNSGVFETLVGLDARTLELYPWLAESWGTEDGQNWTFKIREGVKYHSGRLLTPESVKANLERLIGANPGLKTALKIESIAVEGQNVRIRTETPYPALVSGLVHFNVVMMDLETPDDAPPAGTGSFKFVRFDPTATAELVRFEDYWGEKARIDRVFMTANQDANARLLTLQAGDADVIYRPALESLASLRKDDKFVVESMKGTRVYHLLYNYVGKNKDLWDNASFRKGIDALVDREGIIATVMGGEAALAFNPFPGDYPFSPKSAPHPYSLEAAEKHFEAAGLKKEKGKYTLDGKPLKLRIATYIARPELPQIAQVVQDAARRAGLDMEIYVAENIDEFLPMGDWDLATYSLLTISRGDGAFFLNGAFVPNGAQNHGRLNDPKLNTLLEEFNRTTDIARRNTLALQAAQYIEDNAYNCYITVPYETAAYRKGVSGWVTPPNEFEFQMITNVLDVE
jgi:ABC-type dipeptide transport system, periplasmic component